MGTVTWPETVKNKHVVILPNTGMSFDEMIAQGMKIYNDRASGTSASKAKYGKTAPSPVHGNTLIITYQGGFEEINSWILANGKHGAKPAENNVPVKSGAIVTGLGTSAGQKASVSGGTVHFQLVKNGADFTVEHLSGYNITGQYVLTGPEVTERQVILKSHLGGDVPLQGHFKSSQDILRLIDSFSLGQK